MQGCLQALCGGIEPTDDSAQFSYQAGAHFGGIVDREPVGDRLDPVAQLAECDEQVVERDVESLAPHGVPGERIGETQHGRRALLGVQSPRQAAEQLVGPAPGRHERVEHRARQQIAARRAEQIVVGTELRRERRQEAAAVALETPEQPLHAEHADLRAEVLGRDVFQVVGFVQHQAAVGRQDRRLLPIVRRDPHRQVGGEQVVIHHHDVGFGGSASRRENEAAIEVRALEPRAQIRLRRDRIPHVARRLFDEVRQTAVRRP